MPKEEEYVTNEEHEMSNHQYPINSIARTSSRDDGKESDKTTLMNHQGRTNAQYKFRRYIPRAVLNTLGPLFVLGLYLFISFEYLAAPASNGVMPPRPLSANIVFYAWWLLNIFVLDWAKSGIAGFEAAALGWPSLAPTNARQLIWHADQAWASPTNWAKALAVGGWYIFYRVTKRPVEWTGPSTLWAYLASTSLMLYVAIPLSGLSMNPTAAYLQGGRLVNILGVNETTFDARTTNSLSESVGSSWRQGQTTTPRGATIFYAPEGTQNASDTYYEDEIQTFYQRSLDTTSSSSNETVTIFSGPEVSERTYGRAWGLVSNISCAIVHPNGGLKLLNVTSINNWTSVAGLTSTEATYNMSTSIGAYPVYFEASQTLGVNYQYVMATNEDISYGSSDYANSSLLPNFGVTEIVMWQSYGEPGLGVQPDQAFTDLASHPMVVSSESIIDNLTYYGFAVSCTTTSDVGFASLSAATNTFSDFEPAAADPLLDFSFGSNVLTQFPFVMSMQVVAFTAATSVFVGLIDEPSSHYCDQSLSTTCNAWASANAATNGVPRITSWGTFSPPTLTPERLNLAMYKLFGEAAIALMGTGPGNWTRGPNATFPTLGLFGLEPGNDLIPGVVPYEVVIIFLGVWVLLTVVPQLWPSFFLGRRWGETLDGFTLFRLGAEWKDAVRRLEGSDIVNGAAARSLAEVPGMIGDMNPPGETVPGFVGLSTHKASTSRRKVYAYDGA
ncbi:hypothetical protein BX600DRAFT_544384 [Xylariales sp. PMI_506]|nr:hypothetical protein BX600DRAFT_544384 [Xylariales sp. PMI_506]